MTRRLWVVEARYIHGGEWTKWGPSNAFGVFQTRDCARAQAQSWAEHSRTLRGPFARYRVREYVRA